MIYILHTSIIVCVELISALVLYKYILITYISVYIYLLVFILFFLFLKIKKIHKLIFIFIHEKKIKKIKIVCPLFSPKKPQNSPKFFRALFFALADRLARPKFYFSLFRYIHSAPTKRAENQAV